MNLKQFFLRFSPIKLNIHFNDGPFVQNLSKRRTVSVKFVLDGHVEYQTQLKPGQWGKASKRYLAPWNIEVTDEQGNVIARHYFDPAGASVRVSINSRCLGDSLAWIAQIDRFAQQNPDSQVYCSHFWPQLDFEIQASNLQFIRPEDKPEGLYATFIIGFFFADQAERSHPIDPRTIPLPRIAADILGITYDELRPRLPDTEQCRDDFTKTVCFAMESTAGCKHWHYPDGWQQVIDYLNERGYRPVLIQKGEAELDGIVNNSGDFPIEARISDLRHCEFFIGLGSGLSWLAWALGKKVILISGFSEPFAEFRQDCYRVINDKVCHGCWNDTRFQFDRGDWNWCPEHKDTEQQFECTKTIMPVMVIEKIKQIISETTVPVSTE